jgi:hypothetical protein
MSFPNRVASLKQFAALPQCGERNSPMHAFAREPGVHPSLTDNTIVISRPGVRLLCLQELA